MQSILRRCRAASSVLWLGLVMAQSISSALGDDAPPKVGDTAVDFELVSIKGDKIRLSKVVDNGPVVLIVLRGYPGYQCPICSKQVGQLLAEADKFKAAGATVLVVYPGPSKNLSERAKEFVRDKTIPDHFQLLVDPDYSFTNLYHLRWDAPKETAYPSTFIIQKDRHITFAKVSQVHGGRTTVDEVLKAATASR